MPNYNEEKRIRYGIIQKNSINSEALCEILDEGKDQVFREWTKETILEIHNKTGLTGPVLKDKVDGKLEDYESEGRGILYEKDGYILLTTEFEIFVIDSPYYTFTKTCSPCVPGAGDLDNYDVHGEETLCLGSDWFSDDENYNKIPYFPLHEGLRMTHFLEKGYKEFGIPFDGTDWANTFIQKKVYVEQEKYFINIYFPKTAQRKRPQILDPVCKISFDFAPKETYWIEIAHFDSIERLETICATLYKTLSPVTPIDWASITP